LINGCGKADVGRKVGAKRVAVIGMDRELEYLIRAWKWVCKSLQNVEAVGAIIVRVQGNCRRKHWELGMRNQRELCGWKGTNSKERKKDKTRW